MGWDDWIEDLPRLVRAQNLPVESLILREITSFGMSQILGQAESITLLWTISLCSSFAMDHGLRLVRLDQTRTDGFVQI